MAAVNVQDVAWAGVEGFATGFAFGGAASAANAGWLKDLSGALAYNTSPAMSGSKLIATFELGTMAGGADKGMDALRGPAGAVAAAFGRNVQIFFGLVEMDME